MQTVPSRIDVRRSLSLIVAPLLFLALSTATTGCVSTGVNPVSGETRAYGYSWEEELELGREADKQIQAQFGVYEDDELQQYVDRVAQKVLAESHMRRTETLERFRQAEFHFRVLDSPVVNAFALPGGYVYVSRGLLAHLNNEAQLAVVLGHEIGHVAARHASQQAARRQLTQGLLLGGAVLGQVAFGGQAADRILGLGGTAAQLLSLSYSRDNERESDRLGVEYAVRAGYEASEGAAFFTSLERMQEQSGQAIPTWQSTHPDPGAREETIPRLAREWQGKVEGPATEVNRDAYYAELEDIVFGENPRQGFAEEGVFYHPELEFRFSIPAGWQVQNQARQVVLIEPNQEAYVVFAFAEEDTPEAAASAFGGQQGLTVLDRGRTTVNGNEAWRVLAEAQTQQGQQMRILGYFIAFRDNVYRFLGVSAAQRYSQYEGALERSMTSFVELRDPDKLNVRPTRLAIGPASRSAPFRSFAEGAALPDGVSETDLAIVNQMGIDQQVSAGTPLKLPN